MGLIRSTLLVIVSVLFLLSLIATGSFLTLSSSLEYSNIQNQLLPVVKEMANGELQLTKGINDNYGEMVEQCLNTSEVVLGNGTESFIIPCSVVINGSEAVTDKILKDMMKNIYYREYDCNFFDCNSEGNVPFFVVSEHSKDYFSSKFRSLLFLSLILFGLIFLLVEVRSNSFILAGGLMVFSSLVFYKLEGIIGFFAKIELLKFFTFLFTESLYVFTKFLIFGIVLIVFGFIWKTFSLGFKIKSFFDKFKSPKVIIKKIDKKN